MEILEIINSPETNIGKKPHICPTPGCSKSFGRRSDLIRHIRIHTNERPHVCLEQGCGKRFTQVSALKVHSRTHTGERPHQCEYEECGKTFGDSSSLARHRRLHTGKRPYTCSVDGCNKYFAHKSIMRQHQRQSHGPQPKKLSFQWISWNEMAITGNVRKRNEKNSAKPLDIQQTKKITGLSVDTSTLKYSTFSASPAPSEHSSTATDDDIVSSPPWFSAGMNLPTPVSILPTPNPYCRHKQSMPWLSPTYEKQPYYLPTHHTPIAFNYNQPSCNFY